MPAFWKVYVCSNCDNIVTAKGHIEELIDRESDSYTKVLIADAVFPAPKGVAVQLPGSARRFLEQANNSLATAPDGAGILASSAVDSMLKEKGYGNRDESLYARIQAAVKNRLLTQDMGEWAHIVRLSSNNLRHADNENPHLSQEQAQIVVDFAEALGQFLYVLPSHVAKGISDATHADDLEHGA